MAFDCKAIILVETMIPSHRRDTYDPTQNHTLLKKSLDMIEELRE